MRKGKNTLSNPQNINLCYIFTQYHQNRFSRAAHTLNDPKNDFLAAHTLSKTQNEFPTMEKMEKSTKTLKGNTRELPNMWEIQYDGWTMGWACISNHLLTQEVKNTFAQKWVASQIKFWLPYSSHPHELTNSTTFGWLDTNEKMGSWNFYGFSPLAQEFESSPPFLVKSCPHLFNVALA